MQFCNQIVDLVRQLVVLILAVGLGVGVQTSSAVADEHSHSQNENFQLFQQLNSQNSFSPQYYDVQSQVVAQSATDTGSNNYYSNYYNYHNNDYDNNGTTAGTLSSGNPTDQAYFPGEPVDYSDSESDWWKIGASGSQELQQQHSAEFQQVPEPKIAKFDRRNTTSESHSRSEPALPEANGYRYGVPEPEQHYGHTDQYQHGGDGGDWVYAQAYGHAPQAYGHAPAHGHAPMYGNAHVGHVPAYGHAGTRGMAPKKPKFDKNLALGLKLKKIAVKTVKSTKALKYGTALIMSQVVLVLIMLGVLAGKGARLAPIAFPLAILPIGLLALIPAIPLLLAAFSIVAAKEKSGLGFLRRSSRRQKRNSAGKSDSPSAADWQSMRKLRNQRPQQLENETKLLEFLSHGRFTAT